MKSIKHKILACVTAAALAFGMCPGTALASSTDSAPSTGSSGDFSTQADGRSQASTSVNVIYDGEASDKLQIVDQSTHADLSTTGGIFVQVAKGTSPYTATWYRLKAGEGATEAPDFDASKCENMGTSTSSDENPTFTHDPKADSPEEGATYWYWAEITDSSDPVQSVVSAPITFENVAGYTQGAIYDTGNSDVWTWSAGGEFTYGDKTYGGEGSVRRGTVLSAPELDATDSAAHALTQAAAASNARVEDAWQVGIANTIAYEDTYTGNVLMRIDVTEIAIEVAKRTVGENPTADDIKRALDSLNLLWLNPYVSPATVAAVPAGTNATEGAPFGLSHVIDGDVANDGHAYMLFYMPDRLAKDTGVLGAFAVTSPVGVTDIRSVNASASTGGQIDPSGELKYAKGDTPSFVLYPDTLAGYETDYVEVFYGTSATGIQVHPGDANDAGALSGNTFTMAALGSQAADANTNSYTVIAHFKKTDTPPDPEAKFTADISVGATGSERSQIDIEVLGKVLATIDSASNKQLELSATDAPIIIFRQTAQGYVPDCVTIEYTDGPDAGKSIPYTVQGTSIQLPALTGNANISVTYKEGLPPIVTEEHTVEARVADGQSAWGTASASASKVPHAESATFTATPARGYEVKSATVFYRDGDTAVNNGWRQAAVYTTDKLADGTSLTLYSILCDTRVEFTFAPVALHIIVPDSSDGATIKVIGKDKPTDNTYAVTPGENLEVQITVKEGDTLEAGSVTLVPKDGSDPIVVTVTQNEDGTYTANIPYDFISQAGDGATLTVKPTKKPTVVDPTTDLPITVGPDDEGRPIVIQPPDDEIITEVTVDDKVILDSNGDELKDKMEGPGSDGLLHDPNDTGIAYDPDTGEYVLLPSGDRFTYDPITGTIVFKPIKGEHTVDAETGKCKRITIEVRAGSQSTPGGTVAPLGTFKWNPEKDLTVVATPDTGYVLESLFVDNNKVDTVDATADHIEAARDAASKAQIWTGTTDLTGKSQKAAIARVDRNLAANIEDTPREAKLSPRVATGAKAHVVPSSYFAGTTGNAHVQVYAVFSRANSGDDNTGPGGNDTATYIIKSSVRGGHGAIEGATTRAVKAGNSCAITFKPEVGYQVTSVYIDGTRQAYAAKTYTFRNVQADHTLEVEFAPISYIGDNGQPARVLRTLQSLAQTGDLALPGIFGLVCVAAAALGIGILSANRRREEG